MGFFKGEGGAVFEMDEPLPQVIAEQVRKHLLVKVDSEDSADVAVQKPSKTDPKAAWVDYAVSHGDITRKDAEDSTKADLIEKYGG